MGAIACALGEVIETNEDLARRHPDWDMAELEAKTGVRVRRMALPKQCASDLAAAAAEQLFAREGVARESIDFLLFCTSAADYSLPTSACLLQDRLGLPRTAGALDFNLGCSGFVYGLSLARGLVESRQARNVLLLTADTYSRFIHDDDRSTRALFGDAGSATLIAAEASGARMFAFDFGTDGRGEFDLIRPDSGCRAPGDVRVRRDERGDDRPMRPGCIFMDGRRIFTFAISAVPRSVQRTLDAAGMTLEQVDHVVFHQASRFMLEHLTSKLKLPPSKVVIDMEDVGNTVSSTIPLVLERQARAGRFAPGDKLLLCGFGVGYSWASCMLEWGR